MAYENLPVNGFRICIDNMTTDIAGKVYTPLQKEAIPFVGISELLLQMDGLFDSVGYPEAFQSTRTFGEQERNTTASFHGLPKAVLTTEEIRKHNGAELTAEVVVNSRRNSSWQGLLFDLGKDTQEKFESETELLHHILVRT